jgi:mono/diheme cytochrome c family protein
MRGALLTLLVLCGAPCLGAEPAAPPPGKVIFNRLCAECHAAGHGHPGTQQLGWTRGGKLALLERRRDLAAIYVTTVVRRGLLEMPPFRPTEIDDTQLTQLAAYLARGKK